MGLIYAPGNFVNSSTLVNVTSEDSKFVKEYLYNRRPSLPFRFTAKTGNQIKVDLGAPILVTFVSAININLVSPTLFKIKAAAADPPGGGDWDHPDWETSISLCSQMKNVYKKISQTYQHWVLDIDDATCPAPTEVGEYILTTWSQFTDAHIMGDSEGIVIKTDSQVTEFDQDWDNYLSESYRFGLNIRNETTYGLIDEIRTFIKDIQGQAGRFILVSNDSYCQCYYCKVVGEEFNAERVYHANKDILDWTIPIKTLVEGISML